MSRLKTVLLSLPVVAVALGALTVGLIELGRYWGFGGDSLALVAIPFALALAYIAWYRTLPYEPRGAPSAPASIPPGTPGEEPFVDPVEEADQFDQEASQPPGDEEAPAIVEDDTADASSVPR